MMMMTMMIMMMRTITTTTIKKESLMTVSKCPLCGEKVKISAKPWIGQSVDCPACDATLEVISLRPLSLDWPYDDEGYYNTDYDDEEFELNEY